MRNIMNPAVIANAQLGQVASDSITRPDNASAYAANDVIGESPAANLTFSGVSTYPEGTFIITGAKLRIDINAVPSGMSGFRLHLYSAAPTAIADNTAFNLPAGDRSKYLGYLTLSAPSDFGDTLYAQDDNLNFNGKLAAGSTTVYGILETLGAFAPASETVFTISLNVVGV